MRKKFFSRVTVWCVCIMLCVIWVGCGNQNTEETSETVQEQTPDKRNDTVVESEVQQVQENESSQTAEVEISTEQSGDIYNVNGMTITLPAEWVDKCTVVTDSSGISIYQKSSYEQNKGDGYILGFESTTEYMNYGAGENLLGFVDDGTMYYSMQPTDVACNSTDETVLNEYVQLCNDAQSVIDSAQLPIEAHTDGSEYIIPVSSIVVLDNDSLLNLSAEQLRIAKNEIYARHGRMFNDASLQQYFDGCSWYEGVIASGEFSEDILSETEIENLKLIVSAEAMYKDSED